MFIDYVMKDVLGTWWWVAVRLYQWIVNESVGTFYKTYPKVEKQLLTNILEKTFNESFIIHQIDHVRFFALEELLEYVWTTFSSLPTCRLV